MTRDEAVAKAMAFYDKHYAGSVLKAAIDMTLDGISDEEIDGALQAGLDQQEDDRPAYRRQVEAEIDEAARWFRGQSQ